MDKGLFTYSEIISQPEAWAQALEVVQAARPRLEALLHADYDQVLFTGCGSTYYLSLAGAAVFQACTGRLTRAAPGGELLLNPDIYLGRRSTRQTLLVASSRSGSTTETVRAVEQFQRQGRGAVIAITNYGDQPLAGLADVALVITAGQEQSLAQTRSFASMYLAATALATLAAGDQALLAALNTLPEVGRHMLATYEPLARQFGENLETERFYFLGSGARYGLACEVSLKMKEMSLTHSEPFHFLEFRHGPMSMVNEDALVVGLLSEQNFAHEIAVLTEMETRGGNILTLGERGTMAPFHSDLPENGRGVLYLPVLQLMAYYRSLAKGLDPDRPKNLTAVITLDL
jgi:glucosamine--fructose-6-phosphate aminotransferase (isomerizing)